MPDKDKKLEEKSDLEKENPRKGEEEISDEAWDKFDNLMDKALKVKRENPPAQQAG